MRLSRMAVGTWVVLLHLWLWVHWDWDAGLAVALIAAVYAFGVLPFTFRRDGDNVQLELVAGSVGAVIAMSFAGSPTLALPWMLFLIVRGMLGLGGRQAVALLACTSLGVALGAALSPHLGVSPPLPPQRQITYFGIVAVSWFGYAVLILGVVGAAMNRRDAELARFRAQERELTARLEAVTSQLPVGLALVDGEGRTVFVNPKLSEILGLSSEDLTGTRFRELFDPVRIEGLEEEVRRAREEGHSCRTIYPIRRRDGSEAWVETIVRPFDGQVGSAVMTLIDRTAEFEARTRSERLAKVLEVTSDLVAIWGPDEGLLHFNRAFLTFFKPDQYPFGQSIARIAGLGDRLPFPLPPVGEVSAHEADFVAAGGRKIPFSLVTGTFTDEEGRVFHAGVARDISESRAAAQRLHDLLRTKDEFIATVSHELRTPLTAVVGLAHELSARTEEFTMDETTELTQLIAEQSSEVSSIVEDLLTAARAEAGVLTVVDGSVELKTCVEESLRTISADFRQGIVLSGQPIWVRADGVRLRQIVRNLLTNARRYGGPRVEVECRLQGRFGVIEVRDDGKEIPADEGARMFEAYGRRHRHGSPESVGLGLTVSRQLARLMGGDVEYLHRDGWSRFTVRVPLQR
jgi:PAS domain S-box-containing protein